MVPTSTISQASLPVHSAADRLQLENPKPKIAALTALRFFAAFVIIIFHLNILGIGHIEIHKLPLAQGVSFFFVLSGFILTYVYPHLPTKESVARFQINRLARIWPLHIFTLFLFIFLLPFTFHAFDNSAIKTGFWANFFLIHSWFHQPSFFFFNIASWSISTEAFFYLCFPLLVKQLSKPGQWNRYWPIAAMYTVVFAIIALANRLRIHSYLGPESEFISGCLTYNNPLVRIPEFTMGILIALLASKSKHLNWSLFRATLYEILALALIAISLFITQQMNILHIDRRIFGPAGLSWFYGTSCALCFAYLIFVFSFEKGLLSKVLRQPILVLLGEISFAIYLLHWPLMVFFTENPHIYMPLPDWLGISLFLIVLLFVSFIVYFTVEKPARKAIITWFSLLHSPQRGKAIKNSIISLIVISILCICSFQSIAHNPVNRISKQSLISLKSFFVPGSEDIVFGNRFILKGLMLNRESTTLSMRLVWQNMQNQKLDCTTIVHFLNDAGKLINNADSLQSLRQNKIKAGKTWITTTAVPLICLKDSKTIEISIIQPDGSSLSVVNNGGDKKLSIQIEPTLVAP